MKNYIVYDSAGEILRTGACPDEMVEMQAQDGEFVMEGRADDSRNYVLKGEIVEFSPEMKAEKAAREQEMQAKRDIELLIAQKMDEIVRRQAIVELKKEGKL